MPEEMKTQADNTDIEAEDMHEIEVQLKKLRDKADSLTKDIKHMGKEELHALKSKAAHFLGEARNHGGEYMRDAGHKAQAELHNVQKDLSARIRHKPLISVAIAAGIGFMLALIAGR